MNSIIEMLDNDDIWLEYLNYKKEQVSTFENEIFELEKYIKEKKYLSIAQGIKNNSYNFSIPKKRLVNKISSSKKRVIYTYNEDENYILKIITYLFTKRYDNKYSDNCFSFRRKVTVKDANKKIIDNKKLSSMYGYKIDISNYFNSVDVTLLLDKLKLFLYDDNRLYSFISNLLLNKQVLFNNEIISEEKGIMAGIPISSFLANIYLLDLDEYFKRENIFYLRYSDDIVFFTDKDKMNYYINILDKYLNDNKLSINEDKRLYISPNDKWDFLGFSYCNNKIDISSVSKNKIKGKIKRAAKKIYRWKLKKQVDNYKALSVMIRKFNNKFFSYNNTNELTWSLWYFPSINTSESLKEIDKYMQQELRYIYTGKHCKKNYNIRYNDLKKLGYRTLVSEYYKFIN